ncbi:formin-like protein 5 [Choloepus didactylus]|uniref:formin-like protein 5 n=1 Tax=Choloepus didactylus TaxID=27675 RepID=UPI00189D6592|nr:formin-like protein 5 [Choloepus didactylus]
MEELHQPGVQRPGSAEPRDPHSCRAPLPAPAASSPGHSPLGARRRFRVCSVTGPASPVPTPPPLGCALSRRRRSLSFGARLPPPFPVAFVIARHSPPFPVAFVIARQSPPFPVAFVIARQSPPFPVSFVIARQSPPSPPLFVIVPLHSSLRLSLALLVLCHSPSSSGSPRRIPVSPPFSVISFGSFRCSVTLRLSPSFSVILRLVSALFVSFRHFPLGQPPTISVPPRHFPSVLATCRPFPPPSGWARLFSARCRRSSSLSLSRLRPEARRRRGAARGPAPAPPPPPGSEPPQPPRPGCPPRPPPQPLPRPRLPRGVTGKGSAGAGKRAEKGEVIRAAGGRVGPGGRFGFCGNGRRTGVQGAAEEKRSPERRLRGRRRGPSAAAASGAHTGRRAARSGGLAGPGRRPPGEGEGRARHPHIQGRSAVGGWVMGETPTPPLSAQPRPLPLPSPTPSPELLGLCLDLCHLMNV